MGESGSLNTGSEKHKLLDKIHQSVSTRKSKCMLWD